MNNREWLNTLSDEEYVKWGKKAFRKDWDDASVVMSDKEIEKSILKILQSPHETTADEDFAEIGFVVENKQPLYICYADNNGRLLYILKGGNEYDTNNEGWGDELINTVRTIADKKRKEVWGIHEREAEE